MNIKLITFGCLLGIALTSTDALSAITKETGDKDLNHKITSIKNTNLPVIDENGNKINYSQSQLTTLSTTNYQKLQDKPTLNSSKLQTINNLANDYSYSMAHQTYSYGIGIGIKGMEHFDFNSDGVDELLIGSTDGWSLQQYEHETGEYKIIHQTPNDLDTGRFLVEIRVTSSPSNGTPLIVAAYSEGLVDIYNGFSLELESSFQSGLMYVKAIDLSDANNNGSLDLIISDNNQTKIFDFNTQQLIVTLPTGASSIQVGEVNADSKVEVVLNTGFVYQVEGDTFSELWNNGSEFGRWVELGNTDDDPELEIISANAWYFYRAWDAVQQITLWEEENFNTGAFRLIDVTGDSIPEIIIGDAQWGDVHAHDIKTRELLWSVDNPEHGVTNVQIFDGDNDGQLELFWGAGYSSSGADNLFVHDLINSELEWKSLDIAGPFAATAVEDLDGDGIPELVFASWESNSGYDDGVMFVLDGKTHKTIFQSDTNSFGGLSWLGVQSISIGNVDDDAALEIVVTASQAYDGQIHVIDGTTFETENVIEVESGAPFNTTELYDVDNDGRAEIIVGTEKGYSDSPGALTYAINGEDGSTEWVSSVINTESYKTSDIHIADLNQDGNIKVLAVNNDISVINSETGAIDSSIPGYYLSVITAQLDDDSELEIVASDINGNIDIINSTDNQLVTRTNICAGVINSINSLTEKLILATCGDTVVLYDLVSSQTLWSESLQDTAIGKGNSIRTYTVDSKSFFMLGGSNGIYVYADTSNNFVPFAEDLFYSVHWREVLTGSLIATDQNADDELTYSLSSNAKLGQVTELSADTGNFKYSISQPSKGLDTFQYFATDGYTKSEKATVTIELTNTKPSVIDGEVNVHWRGESQFSVEFNDQDGDPLTVSIVNGLARGQVSLEDENTGAIMVKAPSDGLTPEQFTFKVSDRVEDSTTATVNVIYTNDTPNATNRSYSVNAGNVLSGKVIGEDINNDPLVYKVVTNPSKGTLSLNSNTGVFDYTPNQSASGNDSFTFTVSDGVSTSDEGEISITIQSSNNNDGDGDNGNSDEGSSGGGSTNLVFLLLLGTLLTVRRKRII